MPRGVEYPIKFSSKDTNTTSHNGMKLKWVLKFDLVLVLNESILMSWDRSLILQ
jgi:hypothetical protein